MDCDRLKPLFSILENVFISFSELFSMRIFIFGFKFVRSRMFTCQLLNFVLGQAKLAIYMSRKNVVERLSGEDVILFLNLMKSRVLIDFCFYKSTKDLLTFESRLIVIYDCNVCMFTGSCTTNHLTLFPSQLLECLSFCTCTVFEVICTGVQFVFSVSCFLVYV